MKTDKILLLLSFFLLTSMSIEEANFNLAKKWYDEKKYEKSAKEFEEISKKYPFYENYNSVLYYAGKSYFYIKNYDKALYFFEKLYPLTKNNIEKRQASFELAKTYYFKENYKKSIQFFNEFITKYPDSPVIHAALYYLANANEKSGRIIEAEMLYYMLTQNYPQSPYYLSASKSLEEISRKKRGILAREKLADNKTNITIITNYETLPIIITNVIYLTNKEKIEETNILVLTQNTINITLKTNQEKSEFYEDEDLLNALKKENLKGEEELKRYQEIIELKGRLLKMKEKLLEEKKGMVIGNEENN
ncbi:MAG: tetratricopeptide repeat protein [Brevinematia bacterium]